MFSERTRGRLSDIVEDTRRIGIFLDGMTLDDFLANERTLFAVERLLQRTTEATIQIDLADAERLAEIVPFGRLRGLGNRLRHEYRDLNRAVVFDIARVEVPALGAAVELALDSDASNGH